MSAVAGFGSSLCFVDDTLPVNDLKKKNKKSLTTSAARP
jgi:hypothetical protein